MADRFRAFNLLWIVGLITFSPSAKAFELLAETKGIEAPSGAMEKFVTEVERALPPALKSAFTQPIIIQFKELGKHGFGVPACPGDSAANRVNYRYGQEPRTLPWNRRHKVILNKGFLDQIALGPERATRYSCGHGNLYRLAVATAVHEIAHHYDQLNAIRDEKDLKRYEECRSITSDPERTNTEEAAQCRAFFDSGSTVSGKPDFLALMHFLNTPKHRSNRSPDEYEFTDERESFAVNMEYFTLDPEFGCRRPSVHRFLANHFGSAPPTRCESNRNVVISSYSLDKWRIVDLDPSRVYAIHYLLADKGSDVSSGFGHSMFRIVMCSPGRTEVGPDCLKDVNDHIVVSYRANVRGLTLDYAAGLTGKYPSTLFLLKFMDVILEYTVGESRAVYSYPLILTRDQLSRLVRQVQEEFWQYQNRYFFVTNNCAAESLNLIRAALPEAPVLFEDNNITPKMVLNALLRKGMLDRSVLSAKDAPGRYRFAAISETLEASISKLKALGLSRGLSDAKTLMTLSTEQHEAEMERMLAARPDQRKAILGNFLTIEILFRTRANERLEKRATELALELPQNELVSKQGELLPWRLASGGYGIPLGPEMPDSSTIDARTGEMKEILKHVVEEMRPQLAAEASAYTKSAALVLKIIAALKDASQG